MRHRRLAERRGLRPGNLDRILEQLDGKPVYVEQEGPKDSLASAKRNLEYLRMLSF